MTRDHRYFFVDETSITVRTPGALAIYAQDAPSRNIDGSTTFHLAAPLLILPPEMFEDGGAVLAKVAELLNDHADRFFDGAAPAAPSIGGPERALSNPPPPPPPAPSVPLCPPARAALATAPAGALAEGHEPSPEHFAPSIDGPDPEGFEVPDPAALEAVFPALRAGAFAVASDLHGRLMQQGLTVRQAGSMAAHILLDAAYAIAAVGALAEGHDPKPERFAQAARAAAARYDITAIRTEFEAEQALAAQGGSDA